MVEQPFLGPGSMLTDKQPVAKYQRVSNYSTQEEDQAMVLDIVDDIVASSLVRLAI